ncbi:hypothetical protein D9M71_498120 [compost metagenome]
MSKRLPNLMLTPPQCAFCGATWQPAEGIDALTTYCASCADDRRALVQTHFQLKPLSAADFCGEYLLPRRLRSAAG